MAGVGAEHEALRYFRSLTPDEKLENLWMGMRELSDLGQGMIQRQDKTNGSVKDTKQELTVHLEMHRMEVAEVDFVKRWSGRGTGFLAILISLATAIVIIGDRLFWG